ncbi:DUF6183 family protein [Paractinoplanes ovalisporus]
MIGSLMLVRAGVTVRAGARRLTPGVATGSTLYWAWQRRHRPVADLSHGWGSNSQWRTRFRRDYWLPDRLAYNVDADLKPAKAHPDGARDIVDVDLLRYRCSTMTDLGSEQWVWPEHHSEPAPFTLDSTPRMAGYLTELATTVLDLDNTSGIWALADTRIAAGDPTFVADLAIRLRQQYGTAISPPWQYASVDNRLLRLLCMTQQAAAIEQTVRVVMAGDLPQRRQAAQLLAYHQSPKQLAVLFTDRWPASEEVEQLRSLVLHELILRSIKVEDIPDIAEWATSPHRSHQVLDRLSYTLTAVEGRPALPRFQLDSTSYPVFSGKPSAPAIARVIGARVPGSTETTTTETAAAIGTAVASWVSWSNGQCEARTFELTSELADGALADTLTSLGLQCLGTTAAADLHIYRSSPGQVWQALFDAAANGGAYTAGEGGAQGRLSAWLSLAGLTGCSAQTDIAEVEYQAGSRSWYTLDPTTRWFDQTGWDIAVIAVSPDRRHLRVLAATDAD